MENEKILIELSREESELVEDGLHWLFGKIAEAEEPTQATKRFLDKQSELIIDIRKRIMEAWRI